MPTRRKYRSPRRSKSPRRSLKRRSSGKARTSRRAAVTRLSPKRRNYRAGQSILYHASPKEFNFEFVPVSRRKTREYTPIEEKVREILFSLDFEYLTSLPKLQALQEIKIPELQGKIRVVTQDPDEVEEKLRQLNKDISEQLNKDISEQEEHDLDKFLNERSWKLMKEHYPDKSFDPELEFRLSTVLEDRAFVIENVTPHLENLLDNYTRLYTDWMDDLKRPSVFKMDVDSVKQGKLDISDVYNELSEQLKEVNRRHRPTKGPIGSAYTAFSRDIRQEHMLPI